MTLVSRDPGCFAMKKNLGPASAMHHVVLHRVRDSHLNHFARNCPIALSQFSMCKVREILPSLMVWMSIAIIRKLFPVCGTPNRSPRACR